jgi:hypothetical protein
MGGGDGGSWKSIGEGRGGSVAVGGWEASRERAVEERTWHADVDERVGAKSQTGGGWHPFYGGPVAQKRERVGGVQLGAAWRAEMEKEQCAWFDSV